MDKYTQAFQEFFGPLSGAQRAMFVGLVLLIFMVVGGLLYWSQQEEEMLLFGSLEPEIAQEIVTELNNRGINYKLEEGGRAIYVSSDRVHELRLELAPMSGGLSDVKGYELFDQNALGMTDFMQQVNRKRALEGELARTINSLDQVDFSRIHLVLPERSPFEDTAIDASASVIVNIAKGKKLTDDQVNGITSLIAGSVEGLDPMNVTVLDQAGNRLTEKVDADSEFGFGSTQMQLRQKTEAYLTDRGQTMLDRVLGAGNSILRVSVEHDFDRLVRESDLIDPDSRTVISEEKRQQTNNDELLEPVPVDQFTPANQRGEAVVVADNNNESLVQTRNYEVNRTREVFEKTQGEIKRISASVLLNYKQNIETNEDGEEVQTFEPYSDQEVEEFREVVQLALGITGDRGDQLTIKQVEFFDKHFIGSDPELMTQPTPWNDIFRWSVIGITFLVILFMIRSIKKGMTAEQEELKTTSSFEMSQELDGAEATMSLPGQSSEPTFADAIDKAKEEGAGVPKEIPQKVYKKHEIEDFVSVKPAQAAQIMRAFLSEDKK
jgi:flagellar M-ring protein FliF